MKKSLCPLLELEYDVAGRFKVQANRGGNFVVVVVNPYKKKPGVKKKFFLIFTLEIMEGRERDIKRETSM